MIDASESSSVKFPEPEEIGIYSIMPLLILAADMFNGEDSVAFYTIRVIKSKPSLCQMIDLIIFTPNTTCYPYDGIHS